MWGRGGPREGPPFKGGAVKGSLGFVAEGRGGSSYVVWLLTQRKGPVASSGDVIILEEAAYVSSGFFYETVAPMLCIGMYMLHHCIA